MDKIMRMHSVTCPYQKIQFLLNAIASVMTATFPSSLLMSFLLFDFLFLMPYFRTASCRCVVINAVIVFATPFANFGKNQSRLRLPVGAVNESSFHAFSR